MEEREFFWTFEAMGTNIKLVHEVNAMGRVVFCGDDQFMFRLIFFQLFQSNIIQSKHFYSADYTPF